MLGEKWWIGEKNPQICYYVLKSQSCSKTRINFPLCFCSYLEKSLEKLKEPGNKYFNGKKKKKIPSYFAFHRRVFEFDELCFIVLQWQSNLFFWVSATVCNCWEFIYFYSHFAPSSLPPFFFSSVSLFAAFPTLWSLCTPNPLVPFFLVLFRNAFSS